MNVRELTTEAERRETVPILQQLWTGKSTDEILAWTGEEDYRLFGGFVEGELVAVAGVLEANVLHHARHAWLYDLVVDEPHRGRGYGGAMVDHVEAWADERGCEYVALASPRSKDEVHRFYDRQDYEKWGYVLEKRL